MRALLCALLLVTVVSAASAAAGPPPFYTYLLLTDPNAAGTESQTPRGSLSGAAADARTLGLNTIYLTVDLQHLDDMSDMRAAIGEAQRAGVKVIVAIPTCQWEGLELTTANPVYVTWVKDLIRKVVTELGPEEGVTAWATGDLLERGIRNSSGAFQRFLKVGYPTLAALNQSWGASFKDWTQVSVMDAATLDKEKPYGCGRASIDLADFRRQEFHDLMALWSDAIRALDPRRPLLTGRVSLYRSLDAIPEAYSTIQVWMPPDVMEGDEATHNVQALAMASRGGRFGVIPVFRFPVTPSPLFSENALKRWIGLAALNGASGFGFESSQRIRESNNVRLVLSQLSEDAGAFREDQFNVVPRGSIAMLWEPYAEGFVGKQQPAPAYGYVPGLAPGEPRHLLHAFNQGTCFGLMDILRPADLSAAELDRYGVIFCPMALKLGEATRGLLQGYMERGGVVVADLGLGLYETGAWTTLSPAAAAWSGADHLFVAKIMTANFTFSRRDPLLPSVRAGLRAVGFEPQATSSTEQSAGVGVVRRASSTRIGDPRASVDGPVAYCVPTAEAQPLAIIGSEWDPTARPLPLTSPGPRKLPEKGAPAWAGIFLRPLGFGAAIFATFPLWCAWDPADPAFEAFHGDLSSRRALYQRLGPGLFGGQVRLAALGSDGFRLLNMGAATTADILCHASGHRPYVGVCTRFSAAAVDERGMRTGAARALVPLAPGDLVTLRAAPIMVQPEVGEVTSLLERYDAKMIVLNLAGAGSALRRGEGGLEPTPGRDTAMRLTFKSGAYALDPGSRHLVTLRWADGRQEQRTVDVGPNGQFRLEVSGRALTVIVTPG